MESTNSFANRPGYKWWVLGVVQCSFMLIGVDSTIVNLALPSIAMEMKADLASAQWTIAAFFTTAAVMLPVAGRLADLLGLKTVFIAGFTIFTASSVGCGLALNLDMLIAMRIVQAIGAAALLANSNVITLGVFPLRQHALAIGINGTIFSLGFACGYTLGGFLIQWFGWRSIFWVNLPIGLLAIGAAQQVLVESKIRAVSPQKASFDFMGALLSVGALGAIMISLDRMSENGALSLPLGFLLILGLAGVGAFIFVELRTAHPLLDVRLFRHSLFSIGLVTRSMSNGIFAGSAFMVPFYTQTVLGFSPVQSGLMMVPFALAFAIAGPLSGRAVGRFGSRNLTVAGFLCTGLGLVVLACLSAVSVEIHPAIDKVVAGMALLGLGSGLFISPNSGVTLDSVPKEKSGAASGMLYFMAFLGSAIGTAYAASILSNSLRAHGGLAALHDTTSRASSMAAFVDAQHFVFSTLLLFSFFGAALCWTRNVHPPKADPMH